MKTQLSFLTAFLAVFFLTASLSTHGQAVDLPFTEDFEAYDNTDDFLANSGWTTIDADGDGNNWFLHYDNTDDINVMASRSWDGAALDPENYLVTPQLNLPSLNGESQIILRYHVAASGNNFFQEHYKVVVSTGGNDASDFIDDHIVFEETLTATESGWNFAQREINISGFAGAPIYIAIVHFDSSDQDRLLINNFSVELVSFDDDLPFIENFNAYADTYDFLANSGWTTIDEDGDGNNWFLHSMNDKKVMASYSWDGTALEPENYLITPQIQLPQETGDGHILLTYEIAATGNNFFQENYKVVVSTTGNGASDFTDEHIVWEETLGAATSGSNFALRIIDLEAYAGQAVWIAFVHYDCTDQDALLLNNVAIRNITSAVLHPEMAEYNPLNPADISTTIHWINASEVTAIHHGSAQLVEGTDYTVTDQGEGTALLTFMASYFEDAEANIVFTLSFDAGDPVQFTVIIDVVVDPASLNPGIADFDPQNPADVSTTIDWGSAGAVTGLKAGADVVDPAHYAVEGNVLTIAAGFFADAEPGFIMFHVSFDLGADAVFVVRVFDHSVHPLPFAENFTGLDELGGTTPEEWLPNGWRSVDADGDDYNWYWVPVMENDAVSYGRMQSRSAVQVDGTWIALTPDNWLITPEIQLDPITGEGQSINLTFRVAPGASTPGFKLEHYSVMISYTDLDPASFMEIYSETLSQDHPQNELQLRDVELSFYEGQTVYIAFRHHDVSDMDRLLMSDVQIKKHGDDTGISDPQAASLRIYPNPARDIIHIASDARIREVSLTGITGNVVLHQRMDDSSSQLNISNLVEGIYLLRAVTEQGTILRKLQVVK